MKSFAPYFLMALCIACNTSEEKRNTNNSENETPTVEVKKKIIKEDDNNIFLPQKGDYSALFSKQDCAQLITLEELSKLKGSSMKQEDYGCNFTFGTNEPPTNRISFLHQRFPKESVEKEIKNYIKDAPFIYQEISASGDTYLCHQPAPGRVLILNPNYSNTIMITYSKRNGAERLDEQTIEENKKFAVQTANFLIEKHSK
ncbi:MAG: hypothetical protein K0U54_10900 [Bacteroidetes bacterium]|nr:hypothetical protein [Bacteroidota bacterium]